MLVLSYYIVVSGQHLADKMRMMEIREKVKRIDEDNRHGLFTSC